MYISFIHSIVLLYFIYIKFLIVTLNSAIKFMKNCFMQFKTFVYLNILVDS